MRRNLVAAAVAPVALILLVVLARDPGWLAAGLAGLGVIAAVALWRSRLPRRRLDKLFWAVTLRPLAALPPEERARRIEDLSQALLHHPVHGPRHFPATHLRQRYASVAEVPLERLLPGDLLSYRQMIELSARRR